MNQTTNYSAQIQPHYENLKNTCSKLGNVFSEQAVKQVFEDVWGQDDGQGKFLDDIVKNISLAIQNSPSLVAQLPEYIKQYSEERVLLSFMQYSIELAALPKGMKVMITDAIRRYETLQNMNMTAFQKEKFADVTDIENQVVLDKKPKKRRLLGFKETLRILQSDLVDLRSHTIPSNSRSLDLKDVVFEGIDEKDLKVK